MSIATRRPPFLTNSIFVDHFHFAAQSRDPQPRPAPTGRCECTSIFRRSAINGQELAEIRPVHVLQAGPFNGRLDKVASLAVSLRGFVARFER